MKTLKIIPILFFSLVFNCYGQNKQKDNPNKIKPDENIQVNKEYDEQGNLIKYDSIYSYSYSSSSKLNDSIKMQFQRHFKNHSFFNDAFFDNFFKNDSLIDPFDQRNFFFDGFINQDDDIKNMMRRMDSIQQMFFNLQTGPMIPAEPEKIKPNTEKTSFKQI
ncbi:hypothetical protein [Litoribaculum gwangyangense]|uniref:Uncharacterized protein n=1 Tax=Litoribaculum gwangyangense TaxID=1130722 RepID=A0ABP9C9C5_9FLAO